jgi:NAD(P)-dependent dehydrogenase (short-subunit alcohol dehydrogenase family)
MSEQRVAVVTGASSGFGRLTAEAFAAAGWRVYATLRDAAARNAGVAAELRGAGAHVVELDVTSDASVDAAARTILAEAGAVDVLVNNAGSAFFGILEAFTPAAVERQFATNVIGPLRVNRAFLPSMRERKAGLIVFVSSVVGRVILPFSGVYTASKFALEALAETSAYELAAFGIDVAIVEPGAFATDIFSKVAGADDAERIAAYGTHAQGAQDRIDAVEASGATRDPRDVAQAILQLANAAPGTRPLRVPIPENPAVTAANAALGSMQRKALEGMGLGEYLPKTAV